MNGRWQSYGRLDLGPVFRARAILSRQIWEDEQNAAAYRLHLRDEHEAGRHDRSVAQCDFCGRAR